MHANHARRAHSTAQLLAVDDRISGFGNPSGSKNGILAWVGTSISAARSDTPRRPL